MQADAAAGDRAIGNLEKTNQGERKDGYLEWHLNYIHWTDDIDDTYLLLFPFHFDFGEKGGGSEM